MDRSWLLKNIDAVARSTLDLTDEWEFRRLLEVYQMLDPVLLRGLVEVGQQSAAPELREAAHDFANQI